MSHDTSKSIKLSNENIAKLHELGTKFDMNDSEVFRLGLDLLHHFETKGELLKIMAKILEK
ncbi:MAG: hypothetical protein PHE67_13160 [Campylobacterales bacterium]|nr:hypothetical protein [Campylobacterales bacterium]